ncbi:MAG TPA: hypothetical protein VN660_03320 [Steroidobacteraceae bacterium]|nr:hypothetical protein [Steroidobacteraceae bacterium]
MTASAQIANLVKTMADASRAYWGSHALADWNAYQRAVQAVNDERSRLREAFARAHGWRISLSGFSVDQLRTGRTARRWNEFSYYRGVIDHPDYFRTPGKPSRPAAIITHTYASLDDCIEFTAGESITAKLLPESWYYPGGTIAVLFTKNER